MTALLERARSIADKRGCEYLILLPATASLYDMYKKRGFTQELYCREALIPISSLHAAAPAEIALTDREIELIRRSENNKTDYCIFSRPMLQYIIRSKQCDGGIVCVESRGDASYCFYEVNEQGASVSEAFSSGGDASPALYAVMLREKCDCVTAVVPAAECRYAGKTVRRGLVCSVGGKSPPVPAGVFLGLGYG